MIFNTFNENVKNGQNMSSGDVKYVFCSCVCPQRGARTMKDKCVMKPVQTEKPDNRTEACTQLC